MQSVEEAQLFFKWKEDEDPEDVFLTLFLEHKTYFVQHTPIRKVFLARLNKLNQTTKAYRYLLNIETPKMLNPTVLNYNFTENWLSDFNLLHQARTKFKQFVFIEINPENLISIVENWLSIEENYHKIYGDIIEKKSDDNIIASKENDAMELLQELQKLDVNQVLSIENLKKSQEHLPELLQNELKRLNLLSKL